MTDTSSTGSDHECLLSALATRLLHAYETSPALTSSNARAHAHTPRRRRRTFDCNNTRWHRGSLVPSHSWRPFAIATKKCKMQLVSRVVFFFLIIILYPVATVFYVFFQTYNVTVVQIISSYTRHPSIKHNIIIVMLRYVLQTDT